MNRNEIPARVAQITGKRVRWAGSSEQANTCTIEVFNADANEQLDLLRKLRDDRPELEAVAGGPLTIIFHTVAETKRLYGTYVKET